MRSDPLILAFDTSAAHCAAALLKGTELLAERRDAMSKGQAEHVMVLIESLLREQNLTYAQLDAIGVGIGPGNFTGIRISVSAARGLALGLGIPAIGVSRFDVIARSTANAGLPCVAAPQNRFYVRELNQAPRLTTGDDAALTGQNLLFEPEGFNPAPVIAAIAAQRLGTEQPRPAPLYIKEADAAPARDAPPTVIP